MPSEEPASGEHGEEQQDPSQECGKALVVVAAASPPPLPEQAKDPTEDPPLTDENSEFLVVNLTEIRKIMQCPICLGIIRKTRTVMECLHRFCRECIDKSMRLGNNECPACRTHCASRRSLRDDPNFDSLIAGLYEDVDKYEEEEMSLLEEETWKNKQIQANIAETAKRQSEALAKRRSAKVSAAAIVKKALRPGGRSSSRGRTRRRGNRRDSSPFEDGSDEYTERETPVEPRRTSTRKRQRPVSFDSSASVSLDESNDESEEEPEMSPGPPPATEDVVPPPTGNGETMVSWARGAARSHSRHSNAAAAGVRHVKCSRASSLFESLSSAVHPATNELDVQFSLQALPDEGTPSNTLPPLERPFISCSPKLSIQQLCSYIMSHDLFPVDTEIEILVGHAKKDIEITPEQRERFARGDLDKMKIVNLIALDNTATMGDIYNTYWNKYSSLTLLYRRKGPG